MKTSIHRDHWFSRLARIVPMQLLKAAHEQRSERANHRTLKNLKVAFSELYLMLTLLKNYQVLNFTGFRKIMKKHDKLFQTTRGEEWR